MTIEQIGYILNSRSLALNTWVDFEDLNFDYLMYVSGEVVKTIPGVTQFYFDSSTSNVYVRYIDTLLFEPKWKDLLKEPVEIIIKGEVRFVDLKDSKMINTDIGPISCMTSAVHIAAFMKERKGTPKT